MGKIVPTLYEKRADNLICEATHVLLNELMSPVCRYDPLVKGMVHERLRTLVHDVLVLSGPKVLIEVRGGVVEVMEVPDWVDVQIKDWDIEEKGFDEITD